MLNNELNAEALQLEIDNKFAKEIELIMSGKKALSFSSLSQFMESPHRFKVHKTQKEPPTKAMIEGSQFHCACLEPEVFKETYFVLDDEEKVNELIANGAKNPRATKDYKIWKEEQLFKNLGKEEIDKDLYYLFMKMEETLNTNAASAPIMAALKEKEQLFKFTQDNFSISGKIDGYGEITEEGGMHEPGEFTVDLKKVANAHYSKVKWKIKDDKYDVQGVIYTRAKNIRRHYLIFIDAQCNVSVVQLSIGALEVAEGRFEYTLEKFAECAELDQWNESYNFWNGGYTVF